MKSFKSLRRRDLVIEVGESAPECSSTVIVEEGSKSTSMLKRYLTRKMATLESQSSVARKIIAGVRTLPPFVRFGLIFLWLLWKLLVTLLMIRLTLYKQLPDAFLLSGDATGSRDQMEPSTKILYIVTALAEYNSGTRSTVKGQDRLGEILIPVLIDGLETMISPPFNYSVDVYLILGYTLKPERHKMILDRLPASVSLRVWDDAIPLDYDAKLSGKDVLVETTRALARQHRYVIRDNLYNYDLFLALEDDMRFTGEHVHNFVLFSQELEQMMKRAPKSLSDVPESDDPKKAKFFGEMTQDQMKRLIPGFIRVEALVNETVWGAQKDLEPIEMDFDYNGEKHINPVVCCHIPNMRPNLGTPIRPAAEDIVIWETAIRGLSVRQLPNSEEWVILLPGPGKKLDNKEKIGGYWSGRNGEFGDIPKPSGGQPDLIAQQGGWLATREQIIRLDQELCMGRFLPPFDPPKYFDDGQESFNVEFWSGGYQHFTGVKNGCNMQRLIRFDPELFSKHLIYHVANNKQKQLTRQRMLRADNLFAQLNTVRKKAMKAKAKIDAIALKKVRI